jgi:hypothetical protein
MAPVRAKLNKYGLQSDKGFIHSTVLCTVVHTGIVHSGNPSGLCCLSGDATIETLLLTGLLIQGYNSIASIRCINFKGNYHATNNNIQSI